MTEIARSETRRMPAYPEYKDSGVEWLGEIPSHWALLPLKYTVLIDPEALSDNADSDFELEYVDIGSVNDRGEIDEPEHYRFEDAPSRARKIVRDGDTIISTVRTYLRAITHIDSPPPNLVVSTGFAVLRPAERVDASFLGCLISSQQFVDAAVAHSQGIGYPAISTTELGNLPVQLPPLDEQRAIAAYLDRETEHIDTLVAKKERLIELLQEKRTALISRAVTKGLDPDVEMQDSGIGWMEEIPADWDTIRCGALFEKVDERGFPDLPLLNVSIRSGVTVRQFSDDHIEQQAEDWNIYKRAKAGYLAWNKMRFWQGAVGVAPVDGLVSPDYTVARCRENAEPRYYEYLFRTNYFKTEIDRHSYGMVEDRNRLYWDRFKQIQTLHPPVSEQREVVKFLDSQTAYISGLVEKVQEGIERMKEYRTALISAAVTGQIDVRDAAPETTPSMPAQST